MVVKGWMPMLVLFPRAFGFTLLELLVVLGLIGLVSSVTFPGLLRFYNSISRDVEQQEIIAEINSLGRRAWETREPFVLAASILDMPTGWRLESASPVRYRDNGICLGGEVRLIHDDVQRKTLFLKPPYCQVPDEG